MAHHNLRRLVILFGVATTTATLAGCAGAGPANSTKGSANSTKSALTVTYQKSGTYDKAAESLIASFKAKTGVDVTVDAFPHAVLIQNNTNAVISGGCQYNVISGSYYLSNIYQNFRSLDELAAKSHYADQLAPGLWEHSEFADGKHIGVPYGPDAFGLMYRTDLFTKAGLSWPTTWPELLADLKVLKSKYGSSGIAPFAFAGGESDQLPALFFATYDGYFFDKSGHFALDSAKAQQAIEFAQQMFEVSPNIKGTDLDAANAQFLNGNAAVLYGWPSYVRIPADDASKSKVAGKWKVGTTPDKGMVWLSLWQMYMTKCTVNVDAAWNWMTTFSNPATDKTMFTKYGVNPSFKATYADPELAQKNAHYFPGEQANLARAVNPPLSGEAQDFLAAVLGDVVTGKTSPSQAVSQINSNGAP